ncbi:translation initiation factor IF-2 [Nocardiopsis alba]|uniref:translation initiation factor IF-2 n=1 Tax=Nocardiopsis alba TaxID=53437 RepID=UPI0033B45AA8
MKRRGPEWATIFPDREVLAVVRSVPAAGRLLDVTSLLADDRIGVTFTVTPGSASESGVEPLLRAAGVEDIVPWEEAVEEPRHLALAASGKGDLHRLDTPLVLMPHGAGHNRRVGESPGSLEAASGLDPAELSHEGEPIAARFLFSHREQLERLHRSFPAARGRGVVVGDPAFDRMLAAAGRRDRYREALDVGGRRLVVVSSTWNRGSLLGTRRDLIRDLLAELPYDEYRVALVAHPNVWQSRGRSQLELWLSEEIEAGLVLIPPSEGWRAALTASDVVVGDVGSVTYYAAALGRPVLLAAFDTDDIDPGSPLLEFGAALPRLTSVGVADQVDRVLRSPIAPVADLLIEHHGGSAARLRSVLYSLLSLPEPGRAAYYPPLPDLEPCPDDVTAWRVAAEITTVGPEAELHLRRHPSAAPGRAPARAATRPLVVDAEDTVVPRWDAADAWSRRRARTERDAGAWAKERVNAHPRARVAVASTGPRSALLVHRRGAAMRVHDERASEDERPLDASLVAAAAVVWARREETWRAWHRGVTVHVGDRVLRLRGSRPSPEFDLLEEP